jgi:hypothetical protein
VDKTASSPSDASSTIQESPSPTASFGQQLQLFVVQSPKELRSIELFFLRAAPQLSGYFQETFWGFVLQFSFEEPAIRHALVAVSAVYENDCFEGWSPYAGTPALKKLSLEYYNRAIRSMVRKLQDGDSIVVPAMGCVLFVCLEFLRRDIKSALNHIEGGIKMISDWRARREGCLKCTTGRAAHDTEMVERLLVPMFSLLNTTTQIFGRPTPEFYSRNGKPTDLEPSSKPLRNLEHSIISLLDLLNASMRLVHAAHSIKYTDPIDFATSLEQLKLLRALDEWKMKFELLEQEQEEQLITAVSKGINLLKANHLAVKMVLSACLNVDECGWDAFKDDFEEVTRLSGTLMNDTHRFPDEQSKLFSFELGIIPPLQIVARKCRYPNIRRKALSLLSKSPKRECLFDARYCTALDERLMEIEEASLKLPPGQTPAPDQLPPEHGRIHLVFFAHAEESPMVWPVTLLSKPFGIDGQWHIHKENIDISKSRFNRDALLTQTAEAKEFTPRTNHRTDAKKLLMLANSYSFLLTADA